MITREEVFDRVRRRGWHQYRILGGPLPSWSYSIGCWESYGAPELVFAGGSALTATQISRLLTELMARGSEQAPVAGDVWVSEAAGPVGFGPVHDSWAQELLLGAEDFYGERPYERLQVVPEARVRTLDVPDLAQPLDTAREVAWRWLSQPWPYRVARGTLVVTDLQALHGGTVLSVRRRPDGVAGSPWDLFAMADDVIPNELARAAPLGVLIAADPSLDVVDRMEGGHVATRRDGHSPWEVWVDR